MDVSVIITCHAASLIVAVEQRQDAPGECNGCFVFLSGCSPSESFLPKNTNRRKIKSVGDS